MMQTNLARFRATEFVQQSLWYPLLTDSQRARVTSEVIERVVLRGAMVYQVGKRVEYWNGVSEGLVKISMISTDGRTSTFTGLAAGAWFGEAQLLRAPTWDFDGVAMQDTRLTLIPRATFLWLLDTSPAFTRYVMDQLNERLAQALSIIETQRLQDPDVCVARSLAWLFNPVLYPGREKRLLLSQEEIGYLTGVSRQRVNVALRRLQAASLLRVHYGAVEVVDLDGLTSFGG